jgi:hypothetical protein
MRGMLRRLPNSAWFALFLCVLIGWGFAVCKASHNDQPSSNVAASIRPSETENVFIGLKAEGWTAIGTMLLAAVTLLLVLLGRRQLILIREQSKLQYTLAVCERWDTDPVIDQCLRRLSEGWESKNILTNPRSYRMDAVTILNFLQSICTGVEAGIYDKELVRQFHKDTISDQIKDYLQNGLIEKMGTDVRDYDRLARWEL